MSSIFERHHMIRSKRSISTGIAFKNEILMIYGYPNINFSAYSIPQNVSAVLYVFITAVLPVRENEKSRGILVVFKQM